MLIYNDFSKKSHVIFKKLILTVFKLLNVGAKFRSINIQKYDSGNFTATSDHRLWYQKTSFGIGLILVHWITSYFFYKVCHIYFYCLHLCGTKSFALKSMILVWNHHVTNHLTYHNKLSCNLILKIKTVGIFFYFSSATFLFWGVKI